MFYMQTLFLIFMTSDNEQTISLDQSIWTLSASSDLIQFGAL